MIEVIPLLPMDATTGAVWIAAITGVVQVVQLFVARSTRNSQHIDTTRQLDAVKRGVDGQTDALLKVTGEAQRAIGNLEGHTEAKAEERAR